MNSVVKNNNVFTVPNILTLVRIILSPIFAILYLQKSYIFTEREKIVECCKYQNIRKISNRYKNVSKELSRVTELRFHVYSNHRDNDNTDNKGYACCYEVGLILFTSCIGTVVHGIEH